MKQAIAVIVLLTLLQACASSAPVTNEYLLRAPALPESTAGALDRRVTLNPIWVASYLDREGIVVATSPHQITEARYQQWAEPLATSLQRVLQVEIARSANARVNTESTSGPESKLSINVRVYQYHGDLNGKVKLVAEWSLHPAGSRDGGTSYQFSSTMTTAAEGYPALVETQLALATQLAGRIGNSVRKQLAVQSR
jgi:uncharacterized lipoprotein YmbA